MSPVTVTPPILTVSIAGLYQTRLRSPPRPVSCIGGLGGNIDIPRVGLYNNVENKLGQFNSQESRDKVRICYIEIVL